MMFSEMTTKILKDVEKITDVDYSTETSEVEVLQAAIDDLLDKYFRKCDELEDFEQDVEENYIKLSRYDGSGRYY